jgi:uncharacterized protein (TIGR02453 family)
MAFAGFAPEALRFLEELREHNDRTWFQAHRDEYESLLLEPARDFVEAMGEELAPFAPDVNADPRVGGSIFRIARDTRFSKDKRPYKDHLDLWFWQGAGKSRERPGFWFRLTPEQLLLGAGRHHFERPLLERYREAVVDPERGDALVRAVEDVERAGARIGGEHYKRLPAGFEAEGRRAELLLHEGLFAWRELGLPDELHTPAFPRFCATTYRTFLPLEEWLVVLLDA